MSNDKYVGLDVHQSSIVTAVHNHEGKRVMESIIEKFTQRRLKPRMVGFPDRVAF